VRFYKLFSPAAFKKKKQNRLLSMHYQVSCGIFHIKGNRRCINVNRLIVCRYKLCMLVL